MSVTVTKYAGSGSNDASAGAVAWSSPGTAGTPTPATAGLNAGQESNLLVATDFGFQIPFGAKVLGIEYGMDAEASALGLVRVKQLLRVVSGALDAVLGDFGLVTMLLTPVTNVLGGPSALYGLEWASEAVNSSGFGIAVQCENVGLLPATARLSNLYARVTYDGPVYRGNFGGGMV